MLENHISAIELGRLAPSKQLAFALLVVERMLPALTAFADATGFDCSCYLQAREEAWTTLKDQAAEKNLNLVCLKNMPDTEEFSHELTSQALNAALAIREVMEFTIDGRADHVADVSTLARDSVYLYVSSLEPSIASSAEENSRIAQHPLMKQEKYQENEDFRFLSGLPDQMNSTILSALRARASTQPSLVPVQH